MAWVITSISCFWSFLRPHACVALFLGPSALTNVTSSYAYLVQPEGLMMLAVGHRLSGRVRVVRFA